MPVTLLKRTSDWEPVAIFDGDKWYGPHADNLRWSEDETESQLLETFNGPDFVAVKGDKAPSVLG